MASIGTMEKMGRNHMVMGSIGLMEKKMGRNHIVVGPIGTMEKNMGSYHIVMGNGKENGKEPYCNGFYKDNGKEAGNCDIIMGYMNENLGVASKVRMGWQQGLYGTVPTLPSNEHATSTVKRCCPFQAGQNRFHGLSGRVHEL